MRQTTACNSSSLLSFQSTHPMRGATTVTDHADPLFEISIHAPHAGCDFCSGGEGMPSAAFQSTHPMRGATASWRSPSSSFRRFQSTHPMRGATLLFKTFSFSAVDFNPRTPCGVRRSTSQKNVSAKPFQSTHPMRGATCRPIDYGVGFGYFNPRTPCGVRLFHPPR